jgi:hypothetical protein
MPYAPRHSFEPNDVAQWLLAVVALVFLTGGILFEWFRVVAR